jgi:hypothetical protein
MPEERVRIFAEKKRLSIWLWIVPVLLLAGFVGFFLHHGKRQPPAVIVPTNGSLPELGSVLFDQGKPTLTADGMATIDRAANAMRGNPNVMLRLEGGPPNVDALARVQSVAAYLDRKGIDRSRMTVGPIVVTTPQPLDRLTDQRRVELYLK